MTRQVTAAIAAVACCACLPLTAAAQDVPVVFVHGIFSSGDTWRATANRLTGRLQIEPHVVDLHSTDPLRTQTAALNAAKAWLPSRTLAVGHSQGGLIAREWSKSKALSGILTLGTPHGGAPVTARALDVVNFNYQLYYLVGLAGSFGTGTEFDWITAGIRAYVSGALQLTWGTAVGLASTIAVNGFVPVAPDLAPGSAFLNGLNGGGNLVREGLAVPHRVGIVYTAADYWRAGIAVALAPGFREWAWGIMQVTPPVFEYAAAILDTQYPPWHVTARSWAMRLRGAAGGIREMDPMWCWAVTGDRTCRIPHDGVVPVGSQSYPSGVNFSVYGPAHTEETTRSDTEIGAALSGLMGVAARGAAPPPPSGGGVTGAGTIGPDTRLYPDQEVSSPTGVMRLRYQPDGNLVVYQSGGVPLWASDTAGSSAGFATLQGDGNLVIYDAGGTPIWATDTFAAGSTLKVYDAGYVMIHDSAGVAIWWSGSGHP